MGALTYTNSTAKEKNNNKLKTKNVKQQNEYEIMCVRMYVWKCVVYFIIIVVAIILSCWYKLLYGSHQEVGSPACQPLSVIEVLQHSITYTVFLFSC